METSSSAEAGNVEPVHRPARWQEPAGAGAARLQEVEPHRGAGARHPRQGEIAIDGRAPVLDRKAGMDHPAVLVLWMRTTASPSPAETSPSSTANGPMAEDMLPQLPEMSASARSTAIWKKV